MAQSIETLLTCCLQLAGRSPEPSLGLANTVAEPLNGTPCFDENPYWFLQAGRREAAVSLWETALKNNPIELRIWHELAVAHYWQARDQENCGKNATNQWRKAINYWVGVLVCDDYWRAWAQERAIPCGILPEDRIAVYDGFLTYVKSQHVEEPERVKSFLHAVSAARDEVRASFHRHFFTQSKAASSAGNNSYEDLLIQLNHEWAVACRLERMKLAEKIARNAAQQELSQELASLLSAIDWKSELDIRRTLNTTCVMLEACHQSFTSFPSCGLGLLEVLGMTNEATAFVTAFQTLRIGNTGIDQLLQQVWQDCSLLQFYLDSQLGRLLVMIDLGLYDHCQTKVKQLIDAKHWEHLKELQQLLCLACHNQAEAVLVQHEYETAITAIELAEQYCGTAYNNAAPFQCDMPRLITKICEALAAAVQQGSLSQEAACALLRRLAQVAPHSKVPFLVELRKRLCEEE